MYSATQTKIEGNKNQKKTELKFCIQLFGQ